MRTSKSRWLVAPLGLAVALAGCKDEQKPAETGGGEAEAEAKSEPGGSAQGEGIPCGDRRMQGVQLGETSVGETFEGELAHTPEPQGKSAVFIDAKVGQKVTYDVEANDKIQITLFDLAGCEYIGSAGLTEEPRLTHAREEGQKLAALLSSKYARERAIPFTLHVTDGVPAQAFCEEHIGALTLGEAKQGELTMDDPHGGPYDNMYDSYSLELESGQKLYTELENPASVKLKPLLYDSACERQERGEDGAFEVSAGTYTVLVAAYRPAGSEYELTVSAE